MEKKAELIKKCNQVEYYFVESWKELLFPSNDFASTFERSLLQVVYGIERSRYNNLVEGHWGQKSAAAMEIIVDYRENVCRYLKRMIELGELRTCEEEKQLINSFHKATSMYGIMAYFTSGFYRGPWKQDLRISDLKRYLIEGNYVNFWSRWNSFVKFNIGKAVTDCDKRIFDFLISNIDLYPMDFYQKMIQLVFGGIEHTPRSTKKQRELLDAHLEICVEINNLCFYQEHRHLPDLARFLPTPIDIEDAADFAFLPDGEAAFFVVRWEETDAQWYSLFVKYDNGEAIDTGGEMYQYIERNHRTWPRPDLVVKAPEMLRDLQGIGTSQGWKPLLSIVLSQSEQPAHYQWWPALKVIRHRRRLKLTPVNSKTLQALARSGNRNAQFAIKRYKMGDDE